MNINVNASARAYASASASASSYLNARTYDTGGFRGGGYGGGTVYVGGGYGGDAGYGYVGAPVYYDIDPRALACPSAPFGYVVSGFGREIRGPSRCGYGARDDAYEDRGGRYGYSERHDSRAESRYESYEEYGSFEAWEDFGHDRRDCDCDREPAPYPPPYLPEPPRYQPPPPSTARPYQPRPPRHEAPPRQHYSQEPGERG